MIVKPQWRIPPSGAEKPPIERQHTQTKNVALKLPKIQARKKSTKVNFFGPETAGWGRLPRERVGVEKFVPALESLSSLGFEGRNLGCSRNSAGTSQTSGGAQKVCAYLLLRHVRGILRATLLVENSFAMSFSVLACSGGCGSQGLTLVLN